MPGTRPVVVARRNRNRNRNNQLYHRPRTSLSSVILAMAMTMTITMSMITMMGPFFVAALDTDADTANNSSSPQPNPRSEREASARPPYRGKLKLRPIRNVLHATRIAPAQSSAPAVPQSSATAASASALSAPDDSTTSLARYTTTIPALASELLPRGLALLALGSLAIVEPVSSSASSALAVAAPPSSRLWRSLPSAAATTVATVLPNVNTNVRFDASKLEATARTLAPSVAAALLVAWVPGLIVQGAYWELGWLGLTLVSKREFVRTEILPSLSTVVSQLVWTEFWKRTWDWMLEPLEGMAFGASAPVTRSYSYSSFAANWNRIVGSRIDKWTVSSLKSAVQKPFQASVGNLVAMTPFSSSSSLASTESSSSSSSVKVYAVYKEEGSAGASSGSLRELPSSDDKNDASSSRTVRQTATITTTETEPCGPLRHDDIDNDALAGAVAVESP